MRKSRFARVCILGLAWVMSQQHCAISHAGEITGIWRVTAESDQGETSSVWHIENFEGKLVGVSINQDSEREFSTIEFENNRLKLGIKLEVNGKSLEVTADTSVSDNKVSGSWTATILEMIWRKAIFAKKDVTASILLGQWEVAAKSDDGELTYTWGFERKGDGLVGTASSTEKPDEKQQLQDLKFSDDRVSFSASVQYDGKKLKIEVSGKVAKGQINGEWSAIAESGESVAAGSIIAKKPGHQLAGTWDTVAQLPNGNDRESKLTVENDGRGLRGTIGREDDRRIECKNIVVAEGAARIEFEMTLQGNTANVLIDAKFESADKLEGQWSIAGPGGREAMKGPWSATRVDNATD